MICDLNTAQSKDPLVNKVLNLLKNADFLNKHSKAMTVKLNTWGQQAWVSHYSDFEQDISDFFYQFE